MRATTWFFSFITAFLALLVWLMGCGAVSEPSLENDSDVADSGVDYATDGDLIVESARELLADA